MTATQTCKLALLLLVAAGCAGKSKPSPLEQALPDLPRIDRVISRYLECDTAFGTKVVLSAKEINVGDTVRIRVEGIDQEYIYFISCPGGRIFPYKGHENYQYSLKAYEPGEMSIQFYVMLYTGRVAASATLTVRSAATTTI